jgi:hypothetical protein
MIHVCLQISTSDTAAKIQKVGQILMVFIITLLVSVNIVMYAGYNPIDQD